MHASILRCKYNISNYSALQYSFLQCSFVIRENCLFHYSVILLFLIQHFTNSRNVMPNAFPITMWMHFKWQHFKMLATYNALQYSFLQCNFDIRENCLFHYSVILLFLIPHFTNSHNVMPNPFPITMWMHYKQILW